MVEFKVQNNAAGLHSSMKFAKQIFWNPARAVFLQKNVFFRIMKHEDAINPGLTGQY